MNRSNPAFLPRAADVPDSPRLAGLRTGNPVRKSGEEIRSMLIG